MLSKDEEQKLKMLKEMLKNHRETGNRFTIGYYDVEWLIKKLEEVNNEAAEHAIESYQASKDLADFREHYEG